ncbi:CPBP family intramembrane metalloprotease [Alteromonas sp. 1_MG-2023]|uniref:CPBP family intramembrane glutamic endopeptidase n=1 Tax=Alteromonas sp. 1_MG-2023 TaxID=3062669 RepID=UPI0026E45473|nr:CPBP family intramembrane glutamic endopeptidase [Alteromonas sp. 1_MG-2023]MDO6474827.1 CPBP family intramembrane metalloprotease [Alteromonas sp. 1_MG-2023]
MAEYYLVVSALLIASAFSASQWVKFGLPFLLLSALCFVTLSPVFLIFVALYIYVTRSLSAHHNKQANPWITRLFQLMWFVLSAGLIIHKLPGYQGLLIAENVALKAGSLPASFYLNVDKALFSWSALCFVPLIKRSFPSNPRVSWWMPALLVPCGISAVVVIAVSTGIVTWQVAVPAWFPLLALSNLINTCVAEELLFRSLLFKFVTNKLPATLSSTTRNLLVLIITSAIFGLAHFAGGTSYMIVATVAGLLYGAVYMLTGRIVFAVLTHWLLNVTHMFLLTYPMTDV